MSTLDTLVTATASYGAGNGIQQCMRALRLAGMYDAVDLLSQRYEQIRDTAIANAADLAQAHVPGAHADIISEVTR